MGAREQGEGPPAITSARGARSRIVVVSGQRLIRETLSTSLRSVGFEAATLEVPNGIVQVHAARRWINRIGSAVGLLAANIDNAVQLREAAAVINVLDLDWLLLTSTPPGAAWGALIEARAHDVLGASTDLEGLCDALRRLTSGQPAVPGRAHDEAVRAWREAPEERRALTRRVEALSPREMEILVDLHHGDSPRAIARRFGVSEGTVRTQVKSMLHKLEVNSQIQAVASYRRLNDWIMG